MFKSIFVKNVALDSATKNDEVKTEFFDDKEWKIIVNCGKNTNPPSLAKDSRKDSPSLAEGARGWVDSNESNAKSQITITFFALDYDIDSLVRGYLATFLDSCANLTNLKRENNKIFVDSHLSKDEILSRLAQKDIIQSCEQIELNDKKINRDSVIVPFNGSRAKISREILEANRGFFAESENSPSLAEGARGWVNSNDFPYKARIVRSESIKSLESNESCAFNAESFDTNPKNAIYKTIGKALDLSSPTESSLRDLQCESNQSARNPSLRGESQIRRSNPNDLLDSIIFINFCLDIETLKILILQKCTFIVCAEKPAFSVVRFAQKFGITLIAFIKADSHNADLVQRADLQNSFLILTHQMRFLG